MMMGMIFLARDTCKVSNPEKMVVFPSTVTVHALCFPEQAPDQLAN